MTEQRNDNYSTAYLIKQGWEISHLYTDGKTSVLFSNTNQSFFMPPSIRSHFIPASETYATLQVSKSDERPPYADPSAIIQCANRCDCCLRIQQTTD